MFDANPNTDQLRVLIASADAERRRRVSEIAKCAGLRAVGFIREAEQIVARTRLSTPEVLLMDVELLGAVKNQRADLAELRGIRSLRTVVFGNDVSEKLLAQWKREGVLGAVKLPASATGDMKAPVHSLREALGASNTPPVAKPPVPVAAPVAAAAEVKRKTLPPSSVVIGSSTGGPMALMELLKALPPSFSLPIAVVQHMPAGFTRVLAERLDAECPLHVTEAVDGMAFQPGTVYIAPGGFHMQIEGSSKAPRIVLNTQQPENSCRPAVDVLFRSSARVYGGRQHAIVLTGMGRDGLLGATELHKLGSRIVVQDAATSTVWGMPGAIAQAGLADEVLPLNEIAPALLRCL